MDVNMVNTENYYWENGKLVFTEKHHIDRGYCCGSEKGCRHCPYIPKHIKGNKNLRNAINNTSTDNRTIDT